MGETDLADSPLDYLPVERPGYGGLALGLQMVQGEQRLEELRTPIQGRIGWTANGARNAKCSRHRAEWSALDLQAKQGEHKNVSFDFVYAVVRSGLWGVLSEQ